MSKSEGSANYGIIGNVTARAVAVGTGAKAVVTEHNAISRAQFDAALADLCDQLAELQLPAQSHEILRKDVARIGAMAGDKPEPKPAAFEVFKGLVDKLKMAGVFLQAAAGLQEPIRKLAEWFHIPLPF